jgi:NADH-quinone oxidoreductase subunit J
VTSDFLLFFFLAAFAVTTAVLMVIQRNPLMSAIYLIANFFAIATLYLMLQAQLLAILQILVYAGAIMVLVVFVIMLLNLQDEKALSERVNVRMVVGVMLAFAFLLEMGYLFVGMNLDGAVPAVRPGAEAIGTVEGMGAAMFGRFLLPFEVTSLLLLAAILGAVILAKKRIDNVQN